MFVTTGNITKHVSDFSGKALLVTGNAKIATAHEAAICVSTLVANGDEKMHEANRDFIRLYSSPLSGNDALLTVPNDAMNGFSVRREVFEPTDQFKHLFDDKGEVL